MNLRDFIRGGICLLFCFLSSMGLSQTVFSQVFSQNTQRDPLSGLSGFAEDDKAQEKRLAERLKEVSPIEKSLFKQAKASFDQGRYEVAITSLETFLSVHSKSPLLPEVYLLLSRIYWERGALNRSAGALRIFLDRFPEEPRVGKIRLRLSKALFEVGDLEGVLGLWEGIPGEVVSKILVYEHVAGTYADRGEYLNALHVMMRKKAMVSDPRDHGLVDHEIALLIRENFEKDALLSVVKEFGNIFPADEAMIRLISDYDFLEDYYKEEREIEQFIAQFPRHRFVTRARHLLEQIKHKIKADRYLIAVLLPLSGRLSLFGHQALNGAELALELFKESLPGASVNLVIRDLEEDPSRLRLTLKDWLNEYQPVAVVGPLLSKEVNRIVPVIEEAGLSLITPGATSAHLLGLGTSVFRNAVNNHFLCNAIAEYAMIEMTIERFAVLYPDEQLGRRWVDCFSEGVEGLGGEVVLSESYPLSNTDFSSTILRLKKADLEKDGLIERVKHENGEAENLYTPGFDAIFLPADAVRAGLIIPQLLFHDFKEIRILGTSSWNSPEFLKLAGSYAEGAVFVDGFFVNASDPVIRNFVKRYRERFNQEPDLFSAQSYDATRLILAALKAGALTTAQVKAAVSETIDFPGASGFIYEIIAGETIKEPFYIEVRNGEFVQAN